MLTSEQIDMIHLNAGHILMTCFLVDEDGYPIPTRSISIGIYGAEHANRMAAEHYAKWCDYHLLLCPHCGADEMTDHPDGQSGQCLRCGERS